MSTDIYDAGKSMKQKASNLWNNSIIFRVSSIIGCVIGTSIIGGYGMRFTRSIYCHLYKKWYNIPPGPHGKIPFIGCLSEYSRKDLDFFTSLSTTYGCIVSIMFGPFTAILLNDPKLVTKVFAMNEYRTINHTEVFTGGRSDLAFAFVNGKSWRERRKIIVSNLMSTMKARYVERATKSFTKNKLFPVFQESIKKNEAIQFKTIFRAIGFNIVLQACFGKELKSLDDPFWIEWNKLLTEQKEKAGLQQFFLFMFGGSTVISRLLQRIFCDGDFFDSFNGLIDALDRFSKDKSRNIMTEQEMKQTENEDIKLFNDYVIEYEKNKDGELKFTRRALLGDMAVMFFGSTDTTYSTLAFCLLLAAKNQDIQQELHQELIHAFGQNVDNIELRNYGISTIPKLRAFIHESFRIWPPLPLAGMREMRYDNFTIDSTDDGKIYNVPKGTVLVINVCSIGRNPEYWIKDENENDIEYLDMSKPNLDFWLDENGSFNKQKNNSSFFPFHFGKRNCPAKDLAIKELIIVLAMIFMKYKVIGPDGNNDFEITSQFGGVVNEPNIDSIRFIPRY